MMPPPASTIGGGSGSVVAAAREVQITLLDDRVRAHAGAVDEEHEAGREHALVLLEARLDDDDAALVYCQHRWGGEVEEREREKERVHRV